MVTDIHCHFIPDELFKFVQARKEFDTRVTATGWRAHRYHGNVACTSA
jgi:hypothetical protein